MLNSDRLQRRALLAGGLAMAAGGAGCDRLRVPSISSLIGRGQGVADANPFDLQYSFLLERDNLRVNGQHNFRNGDRFRFELKASAPTYLYVLNRGDGQSYYTVLYPDARVAQRNPLPAGGTVVVPGGVDWFTLDNRAGTERLLLLASSQSIPQLNESSRRLTLDAVDALLILLERTRPPLSVKRVENKDSVRLNVSGPEAVLIARQSVSHS